SEPPARVAERGGGNALARRELREPALLLRAAPGERQGHARERVAEERARDRRVAERLGGERELEHLEARATEGLGDREPRDAELREAPPQQRVAPGAGLEVFAQPRRRAGVCGKRADGLLEELLLLGKAEVHGPPRRRRAV